MSVHRFALKHTSGDLSLGDLVFLYALMRAEGLLPVFFHDGIIPDQGAFVRQAADPGCWFFGYRDGEAWLGIARADNFSATGAAAWFHYCAFEHGRNNLELLNRALRENFRLVRSAGVKTGIGLIPAPYRWTRKHVRELGFREAARLPGAAWLYRGDRARAVDLCLNILDLSEV
jgi:hypothetical protein